MKATRNEPKKVKEVTDLNERQKWLLRTLVRLAEENPTAWHTKKEICELSKSDPTLDSDLAYEYVDLNENPKSHDECAPMWKDLRVIQKYPSIKLVIIDKKSGHFKVATSKEEAMPYINLFMGKALSNFNTYWAMIEKVETDGQGHMDDEAKMSKFYEAYVESKGEPTDDNQGRD